MDVRCAGGRAGPTRGWRAGGYERVQKDVKVRPVADLRVPQPLHRTDRPCGPQRAAAQRTLAFMHARRGLPPQIARCDVECCVRLRYDVPVPVLLAAGPRSLARLHTLHAPTRCARGRPRRTAWSAACSLASRAVGVQSDRAGRALLSLDSVGGCTGCRYATAVEHRSASSDVSCQPSRADSHTQ